MRYDDRGEPYEPEADAYDEEPLGYEPDSREEPEAGGDETADPLEARLERVERNVGVRSYAGGAAVVIALAGAIIAVALALGARDEGATKNDLQELKARVAQASDEATKAEQDKFTSLSDQLDQLSASIDDLQAASATTDSEISGIQSDIDDIQGQISDLNSSSGDSGGVSPDTSGPGGHGPADELGDILGGH